MFPKQKRIVDKKLLEEISLRGCVVTGTAPCDPHHVTTVGAGGHDTEDNVIGLCRRLHQMWHTKGQIYMKNNYPANRN